MKIVIGSKVSNKHIEKLEKVGQKSDVELNIIYSDNEEIIEKEIIDADALIIWDTTFKRKYVQKGQNLKWVQTLTAGIDNFLVPEIKESDIQLTSLKGIHGIPMSEHIFGMLLGTNRKLYQIRENQRKKKWSRDIRVGEIYGKTLVILGLGHIGLEVAKRAKAFGMEVIGVKRSMAEVEYADKIYTTEDRLKAIRQGDIILSILPATKETYHLIDEKTFNNMKDNAILMNFGRGDVVNQADLIDALQTQQIRGAILDVFEEEPLSEKSPLWEMKNVYISPHMSAMSNKYMERGFDIIVENLKHFINGEPMINRVNFEAGY